MLTLFLIPLIASVVFFLTDKLPRWLAILVSLVPLALIFNQPQEINVQWFQDIRFHLRLDSLSMLFIALTSIVIPVSLLADENYDHTFWGFTLLLQSLLIGFFSARDLVLFIFFFEAMLIPLYFIINLWGGANRQNASLLFLVYMIAGSVLMVAGALFLYFGGAQTFDMDQLKNSHSLWSFAIFMLAFAVKTPLFPFHAWLPESYYEASTSGTILLSGLLSKAGIYGILRLGLETFPDLLQAWSPFLLALAIIGVLYGGLAAWMESDYKRLIAYSSFSHVNFILAGLFIWNQTAHSGAVLQALNHGITITALFLVAGWLQQRIGTTSLDKVGGMAKFLPHLCWLTLFFVLASVALPGTNNFVGELMIFYGLFTLHPWLTALLGTTIILSVIYMLRWMQKVYFEEPTFHQSNWVDLRPFEITLALFLITLILWVGIYPSPILNQIEVPA